MEQHRYIFFDNSSGEILATHTHVSVAGPEEPPDPDELRRLYRSFPGQDIDSERLEILNVDADLLGHGLSTKKVSVDPTSRRIIWPENGGGSAG